MNGNEEIIIKIIVTISVYKESKNPMDMFLVENPPVAIIVIPWAKLSKISNPLE